MKIGFTLEGGLRIDVETPLDWMVLRCIPHDARGGDSPLADKLGGLMDADPHAEDWRDFVVPELRDGFDGQLSLVQDALDAADDDGGPAEIFIRKEESQQWYGALNQARLALEDQYGFADRDPVSMSPGERSAWFRSRFYLQVQSLLLDGVMR